MKPVIPVLVTGIQASPFHAAHHHDISSTMVR
jgi:hypothetical protein